MRWFPGRIRSCGDTRWRIRFRTLLVGLAGERTILLSTHIVEDVAQTAPRLAVLATGRVVFQGQTADLLAAAEGQVWTLDTPGPAPGGDLSVVSALHLGATTRYRFVAGTLPSPAAIPAAPTLEDGYVALMRGQRAPATAQTGIPQRETEHSR